MKAVNEMKPTYLPAIAMLSTFVTVHAATYKVVTKYPIGGADVKEGTFAVLVVSK